MLKIPQNNKIDTIYDMDFMKLTKTHEVLCRPQVLSRTFAHSCMNPKVEVAGLLVGPPPSGQYQVVNRYIACQHSTGTATSVEISTEDMTETKAKLKSNEIIIGWAHSHPKYGVFLSAQDFAVQTDFQVFYPDAVALVIDPFQMNNISYGFFRIINGQVCALPYRFLVGRLNL